MQPFGQRLHAPPTEVREPRGARVTAGPNAPLLIRLVRTPFSLQPVRPTRVTVPVLPEGGERPAAPDGPGRAFADLRDEIVRGARPVREDRRPPVRARPFARSRGGEGR